MQLTILLYIQRIRTPFLTLIANMASFLGELPVPLLITLLIYWCISKRKGIALLCTELSAISAMQVLKCIFRVPRPFMKYPDLIKPLRESTSTGYSFPSGHSTISASFYGTLIHIYKKKWIIIPSAILIILIPLSRLYLCVHWPADVIFGTLLGLFAALLLPPLFLKAYDNEKILKTFTAIFFPIALLISIMSAIMLNRGGDIRLLKDLMDTAALGAGAVLGVYLEKIHVDFTPAEKWGTKMLSLIAGLGLGYGTVLAIRAIPGLMNIGKCIGYIFFGFWGTFLYPLIGKKIRLFR